jgi:hypothetical protein
LHIGQGQLRMRRKNSEKGRQEETNTLHVLKSVFHRKRRVVQGYFEFAGSS